MVSKTFRQFKLKKIEIQIIHNDSTSKRDPKGHSESMPVGKNGKSLNFTYDILFVGLGAGFNELNLFLPVDEGANRSDNQDRDHDSGALNPSCS